MNSVLWRNVAALALLMLGLMQMLGDLTGNRLLKGLGAASAMSPCPKVFCDINGLEGFASDFTLRLESKSGDVRELPITAELYSHLNGPYNRRNAYGAALSFAPKLPPCLWKSVYNFGWSTDGPLRSELIVPEDVRHVSVIIRTKTRGRSDIWKLE